MKITLLRTDLTIGPLEAAILRRLSASAFTPPSVYLGWESHAPNWRSRRRAAHRLADKQLVEQAGITPPAQHGHLRLTHHGVAVLEVLLKSR